MGVFRFVIVLVLISCVYAVIRYLKLWKCTGLSPVIYFLIEAVLIGIMVFSAFNLGKLNDNFLVPVFQFISAYQFVVILYSAIFFIIRDIIVIISFVFKNSKPFRTAMYSPKFAGVLLILLSVLAITGFINMSIIRQKECVIEVAKSADVDSMTFAVVSDLHVGTGVQVSDLPDMVEKINELGCDVILIVGDVIDNNTPECAYDALAKELKNLHADKGVYFSYGNHDNWGGKLDKALRDAGITILMDREVEIDGVYLVGRRDDRVGRVRDLNNYKLDMTKPIIVMNHQPRNLDSIAEAGADITFSGHTHGEQFPFGYFLNVPNNDNNYWTKKFGNMTSFVTCGVGGWGFRFKFPSPCEVVKVTVNFTN